MFLVSLALSCLTSLLRRLKNNHTYINYCLPSDEILKDNLKCVEDALRGCDELKCEEKASTLTQKLARETFFRGDVMKRCTPGGTKDFPALPKEEMFSLKKKYFSNCLNSGSPQ